METLRSAEIYSFKLRLMTVGTLPEDVSIDSLPVRWGQYDPRALLL